MPTEELTGKEKEEYMANYDKEVETEQQNRDNEADKFTEQDNLDYEARRNYTPLELELGQFYGTQGYHSLKPLFQTVMTDGVKYVFENEYAWFITDSVAVIEYPEEVKKLAKHLAKDNFLTVTLDATNKDDIKMVIDDGNENILYTQKYDSIVDEPALPDNKLKLFWIKGSPSVYMLPGEY
jgi:hypothetical protein